MNATITQRSENRIKSENGSEQLEPPSVYRSGFANIETDAKELQARVAEELRLRNEELQDDYKRQVKAGLLQPENMRQYIEDRRKECPSSSSRPKQSINRPVILPPSLFAGSSPGEILPVELKPCWHFELAVTPKDQWSNEGIASADADFDVTTNSLHFNVQAFGSFTGYPTETTALANVGFRLWCPKLWELGTDVQVCPLGFVELQATCNTKGIPDPGEKSSLTLEIYTQLAEMQGQTYELQNGSWRSKATSLLTIFDKYAPPQVDLGWYYGSPLKFSLPPINTHATFYGGSLVLEVGVQARAKVMAGFSNASMEGMLTVPHVKVLTSPGIVTSPFQNGHKGKPTDKQIDPNDLKLR